MTLERINEITIDISLGQEPKVPYTKEEQEWADRLKPQIEKIKADGGAVSIPAE